MSSLTNELSKPTTPVSQWMRATFPETRAIQSEFCTAAGTREVAPPAGLVAGTQGAAIDWWLRMLIDPEVPLDLALRGLLSRRAPCVDGGLELLAELGGGSPLKDGGQSGRPLRMVSSSFAAMGDEWFARVSYALALLVELYRAARVEGSRLMPLGNNARATELLALATDDDVADLIAMKELAAERLLPTLPAGNPSTGMTFDGSTMLNADGDLIVGGMLVDFNAGQGTLRKTVRVATLERTELYQVLAYALMDFSDSYALDSVAVYAVRYGYLGAWKLPELVERLSGHSLDVSTLRTEFAEVLHQYR